MDGAGILQKVQLSIYEELGKQASDLLEHYFEVAEVTTEEKQEMIKQNPVFDI